jgi:hypothetical protein
MRGIERGTAAAHWLHAASYLLLNERSDCWPLLQSLFMTLCALALRVRMIMCYACLRACDVSSRCNTNS